MLVLYALKDKEDSQIHESLVCARSSLVCFFLRTIASARWAILVENKRKHFFFQIKTQNRRIQKKVQRITFMRSEIDMTEWMICASANNGRINWTRFIQKLRLLLLTSMMIAHMNYLYFYSVQCTWSKCFRFLFPFVFGFLCVFSCSCCTQLTIQRTCVRIITMCVTLFHSFIHCNPYANSHWFPWNDNFRVHFKYRHWSRALHPLS